jgi:micrococcal nuclease
LWAAQNEEATQSAASTTLKITNVDKQAEYVDIQNVSEQAIDLDGWVLLSERGNQSCTLGGAIQPGETLRVWATKGEPGFSCGFTSNIWSNSEPDPAVLYNPQGKVVSRYP